MKTLSFSKFHRSEWFVVGAGLILFFGLALGAAYFLPQGVDWHNTFRPAARALLAGRSPYDTTLTNGPYAGAPWAIIALLPLALLPENLGRGLLFAISVISFAYAAVRLGAKPVALAVFLLSPPVLHSLLNANLDWLPLLGYLLPPQLGLFFLAVKPQMGSVVAVFWLVETWRKGGWREVLRVFAPFAILLGLSLLVFGLWPLNMLKVDAHTTWWNASLWPASIPVGLGLGAAAIYRRKINYAMAASPCLSPHVLLHSWSAALISVVHSTPETLAAVIGLWLLILLQAFPT